MLTSSIRSTSTDDGATPHGRASSVESVYSQPFNTFGTQIPAGNSAMVMSSRTGIYSTPFEDGNTRTHCNDHGNVHIPFIHSHPDYGTSRMGVSAFSPNSMYAPTATGNGNVDPNSAFVTDMISQHPHPHLHHQYHTNSSNVDSVTGMSIGSACHQQYHMVLNGGNMMTTQSSMTVDHSNGTSILSPEQQITDLHSLPHQLSYAQSLHSITHTHSKANDVDDMEIPQDARYSDSRNSEDEKQELIITKRERKHKEMIETKPEQENGEKKTKQLRGSGRRGRKRSQPSEPFETHQSIEGVTTRASRRRKL